MQADPLTAADEWLTGSDGGRLVHYTIAGAELHHVKSAPPSKAHPAGKPHGLACTHCGAEGRPISTRDELLAFRAAHVACRPVWARRTTP